MGRFFTINRKERSDFEMLRSGSCHGNIFCKAINLKNDRAVFNGFGTSSDECLVPKASLKNVIIKVNSQGFNSI